MNPTSQLNLMKDVGYSGTKQAVTSTGYAASPYQTPSLAMGTGASLLPGGSENNAYAKQQADLNALLKQLSQPQPAYQPKAAYYNTSAAYSQAQQQAAGQVDPLYNKYINELNTQMEAQRQTAQQQNQLENAGIQQNLQNTLQQNQITGQRVGEDTSTGLSNMANAQENYKQTEGMNFDQTQRALQGNLAAAGTSESGLGQQQSESAATQERLGQQAQGNQYQIQRQATQQFMNRSIEDLARGGEIAKGGAELQGKQATLNLNKTMQGIADAQNQQQRSLEQQQAAARQSATQAAYSQNLNNWLNSLYGKINPSDWSATAAAYRV